MNSPISAVTDELFGLYNPPVVNHIEIYTFRLSFSSPFVGAGKMAQNGTAVGLVRHDTGYDHPFVPLSHNDDYFISQT